MGPVQQGPGHQHRPSRPRGHRANALANPRRQPGGSCADGPRRLPHLSPHRLADSSARTLGQDRGWRRLHAVRSVYRGHRRDRRPGPGDRRAQAGCRGDRRAALGQIQRLRQSSAGFREANSLAEFGQRLLSGLMPLLGGGVAGLYVFEEETGGLRRIASYGLAPGAEAVATFGLGEGLVGQCARDRAPVSLTESAARLSPHRVRARGRHAGTSLHVTALVQGHAVGRRRTGDVSARSTPGSRRCSPN